MNVLYRCQSCLIAVGLACLVVGGWSPVHGQAIPSNPLRASAAPKASEAASVAPKASEAASVEQVAATETESVQLTAHVEPAVLPPRLLPRQPGVRTYARTTQPAAFSYGSRAPRPIPRGYVPPHERVVGAQAVEELMIEPTPDVELHDDFVVDRELVPDTSFGANCCGAPMAADCGGCGGCSTCTGCLIPCPVLALDNIELFAGAQAFSGPLNLGQTASFGFHYGLNWGAPTPCLPGQPFGLQIGYRGVSSNYSGASFTEDSRNQSFITAGLFRRVDWGLQGGLVVDILSDKWYYDDLSLTQLRGELSWVFPRCHELGSFFTAGVTTNDVASTLWSQGRQRTVIEQYEPTDLIAFFYRRRFEAVGGGNGRVFGGFTGNGGGLVGVDFDLPLTENWALKTGFTYLIPEDGNNRVAHLDEAWNVGITLVWYPGSRKSVGNDYFRPLFDVADNGVFIPRPSSN
ncbi:MAG: hypothetical protein GXY58_20225 [Planctomycetaceae bacterium]|nr:hypothetical protein [Planctomycetaceae bacterium]